MKRKIAELVLIFTLFFVIPDALLFENQAGTNVEESAILSSPFFIAFCIIVVPKVLILLYILFVSGEKLPAFGLSFPRGKDVVWTFAAAGAAMAVLYAGSTLLSLLPPDSQQELFRQHEITLKSPVDLALSAVFCVVVAYKEELFFRSYLFKRLSEFGFPAVAGMIASSAVFGMLHMAQGLFGVSVAFFIGIIFQLTYRRTGNLHVVAGAHFLYNFLLMLAAYFALPAAG